MHLTMKNLWIRLKNIMVIKKWEGQNLKKKTNYVLLIYIYKIWNDLEEKKRLEPVNFEQFFITLTITLHWTIIGTGDDHLYRINIYQWWCQACSVYVYILLWPYLVLLHLCAYKIYIQALCCNGTCGMWLARYRQNRLDWKSTWILNESLTQKNHFYILSFYIS